MGGSQDKRKVQNRGNIYLQGSWHIDHRLVIDGSNCHGVPHYLAVAVIGFIAEEARGIKGQPRE